MRSDILEKGELKQPGTDGVFEEPVSAGTSFKIWSCEARRWKDKSLSAYRSCGAESGRDAGKGSREGFEMTVEQLAAMLQETGIPFAYDHFAEGESPGPPFICCRVVIILLLTARCISR